MAYTKRAYVEHVAIRVRDLDWYVRFFREALGMGIRDEIGGTDGAPRQVWTAGGVQLVADPRFAGPEGRLAHLGIMVEDQARCCARPRPGASRSCRKGRTGSPCRSGYAWKILQANGTAVAGALAIDPRA